MKGVFIAPTGIGCGIGGHAGDANPAAKLIASVCDTLILHPNVVNASDINEMPENSLYVEGSTLDKFLEGEISLKRVKSNKILVVVNPPLKNDTINAVSAARMTLGIDAQIVVLKTPLEMIATYEGSRATGDVKGWRELLNQVHEHEFDALAIASPITVSRKVAIKYMTHGGVNPWGGVEAKASKLIAGPLTCPVAHAPVDEGVFKDFDEVVDPRMAAEMVSVCYLHCVLKGLHKAPRIGKGLHRNDIDFMVSPWGCVGPPHHACIAAGIPVIVVEENKTIMNDAMPDSFIKVKSYPEAVGVIKLLELGMTRESVTRPISYTVVK